MRTLHLMLLSMIVLLLAVGCQTSTENRAITGEDADAMMEDTAMESDSMATHDDYQGELLAGSESPYLAFTKEDYQKALDEDKTILLYFYANWCPTCRAEQPHTEGAFNELQDENIVGFRVNYKDSDTEQAEEDLAREFGISYQHTKVILKDGQQVLKAPDSWDKARYLEELRKVA